MSNSPPPPPLHPPSNAIGIELEYMIVRADTLDVLPVCDQLIASEVGDIRDDAKRGELTWSNELALHVVEIKTTEPAHELMSLSASFAHEVNYINRKLRPLGGMLLPSAAHPWMDPNRELVLWQHSYRDVYEAFDRIFNCRGHGWANLQSMHINLPFDDDDSFGRLHAAIRVVLPILPALAASSPYLNGRYAGLLDARLDTYRTNCARVPSVTGLVIPEPVFTIQEYHDRILTPLYADLSGLDPDGVLRDEAVNARGAIARFSRNTIEIRVLDVQECPAADLAIAEATVAVIGWLSRQDAEHQHRQRAVPMEVLTELLHATTRDAHRAMVTHPAFLALFGRTTPVSAGDLWRHLADKLAIRSMPLDHILNHGPLAARLLRAAGQQPDRHRLLAVYRRLASCLAANTLFLPMLE